MKHFLLKPKTLSVLTMACLLWACTKSGLNTPDAIQTASSDQSVTNDSSVKISPGIYKITRFLHDGKNETTELTGYRFNFRADGALVARTDKGEKVVGTWTLNSKGTRMVINISGKDALDKVDDEWTVISITDMQIKLHNQDADRVVFTKVN